MVTNRCVLAGSEHGFRQTLGTAGRAMSSTKRTTISITRKRARISSQKAISICVASPKLVVDEAKFARLLEIGPNFRQSSRIKSAFMLLTKQTILKGENVRASRQNQNSAAAFLNAIGFVGSANDRRLYFKQTRRRSSSPITVASIVVNRGETMLELSAVSLPPASNEEEDEVAGHDRGGKRADDEDGGENRVELMNKLIVLRSFVGDAAAAIHAASTAAASLRSYRFALHGSSRCRPLGGCRRWAKASEYCF